MLTSAGAGGYGAGVLNMAVRGGAILAEGGKKIVGLLQDDESEEERVMAK